MTTSASVSSQSRQPRQSSAQQGREAVPGRRADRTDAEEGAARQRTRFRRRADNGNGRGRRERRGRRPGRPMSSRDGYDPYAGSHRSLGEAAGLDEFHIDDGCGRGYDNGLQIFLMGFCKAGRTETQLALEAVNPL